MALALGTEAPGFTLDGTTGEQVSLSSFRGMSNVLLVFYCKNDTPG